MGKISVFLPFASFTYKNALALDELFWLNIEVWPAYTDWMVWKGVVLVPQIIFEHPWIDFWWGGSAEMVPTCGISEDNGHVVPERPLRGGRIEVDCFLVSSFLHVKLNSGSPKVFLTCLSGPGTFYLLFARWIGFQTLSGEDSSLWFAGGSRQHWPTKVSWPCVLSPHSCLPLSGCWNLSGINTHHHIYSPWITES